MPSKQHQGKSLRQTAKKANRARVETKKADCQKRPSSPYALRRIDKQRSSSVNFCAVMRRQRTETAYGEHGIAVLDSSRTREAHYLIRSGISRRLDTGRDDRLMIV
jgi:hypothetical protein